MSGDPAGFHQHLGCDPAARPDFVAFLVVGPATERTHNDRLPAEPKLGMTILVLSVICSRKSTGYFALGTPIEFAPLAVRLGRRQ